MMGSPYKNPIRRRFSARTIGLSCLLLLALLRTLVGITTTTNNNNDGPEFNDDFSLARRQSLGFFDDIPSSHWKRLQEKVNAMSPNLCDWLLGKDENNQYTFFWQGHYEPDFVCLHERRIGRRGDGGKWVCDPHRIKEAVNNNNNKKCLVYSIGSNNDFSFEESVHKDIHPDCEIHTFDFGDYAEGAKKAGVTYHQQEFGLDQTENKVSKSLSTVVEELGHQHRVIDIFKIDCEGCELKTAASWFQAEAKHKITLRQILVELHHRQPEQTFAFFDLMYQNGYVIFHKEFNVLSIPKGPRMRSKVEYAFLKLDREFVNEVPRIKGVDALREAAARNGQN